MTGVSVQRRVGRYEIVREIGRGGTAVVFLARQTDLDRDVALKELAGFHAADTAFVERFLQESRLMGSLNHPNIATVYEYFEHQGTAFISMEYFERGSLRPFVRTLTLPQAAGVLDGILAGLAHAESRGIVHRDLKPENVMVTSTGTVKIADFGVAKALQANRDAPLTLSGTTVGTPAYMAPEQALAGSVGPATDLYAVGVIAYELLTGDVPYRESDVPLGILLQHLNDPVPSPRLARPELDPALSAWVETMLAKAPEGRPSGAAEASDTLDEIVVGLLGPRWARQSRLTGSHTPAASGTTAGATAPTATLGPAKRRRIGRRAALVATAAVLALAGMAGILAALLLTDDGGAESVRSTSETSSSITTTETGPPSAELTLTGVEARERADDVLLTLNATGAALGSHAVALHDADLSDGRAWFEVRGQGITTNTRGGEAGPLEVLIRRGPNRLRVDVVAASGSLSTLTVARVGAHRVVVAIARPASEPPPPPSPPPSSPPPPSPPPTDTTTEPPPIKTR